MSATIAHMPTTLVGDREIAAIRTFDAPPALVWKAWTDPRHVAQWWGPIGFTTSTYHMDVRPGGVWRFVMHGPDGRDYENQITYDEVVPHQRLVYRHGGDVEVEPVNFHVVVTFADVGGKTRVDMRMMFPSAATRDHVIKTYGADKGLTETMGRLEQYLVHPEPEPEPFVTSRTFDAPRALVWKAWTERERLLQWFGPKGFTMTHAELDLRPGGTFHYALRGPDGKAMWGKWVFKEITEPRRIVSVSAFSDAAGNLTRHPLAPNWPLQTLSTTTFDEEAGRTTVTVRWQPFKATQAERDAFFAAKSSMTQGWAGTFDQLAEYLAKAGA